MVTPLSGGGCAGSNPVGGTPSTSTDTPSTPEARSPRSDPGVGSVHTVTWHRCKAERLLARVTLGDDFHGSPVVRSDEPETLTAALAHAVLALAAEPDRAAEPQPLNQRAGVLARDIRLVCDRLALTNGIPLATALALANELVAAGWAKVPF